jgi:uncharacterized protein (TIGR00290 family)
MRTKAWMSWSTGKDSAFALWELQKRNDLEVTTLLTTVTESYDRVSMHAVRRELLQIQAHNVGLPLLEVMIPAACNNEIYENRMRTAMEKALQTGVSLVGFGDLYLEEIRSYRETKLHGSGIQCIFPLWGKPTDKLANSIIDAGFKAILTCIDPKRLLPSFAGREFDRELLNDLPAGVDPCGENGEFHTFVYDGPIFRQPICIQVGEQVERNGFVFADVLPAPPCSPVSK